MVTCKRADIACALLAAYNPSETHVAKPVAKLPAPVKEKGKGRGSHRGSH